MFLGKQASNFARAQFAPPRYLDIPVYGIDLSAGGIKIALPEAHAYGLQLDVYADGKLNPGTITGGEITDKNEVIRELKELKSKYHIQRANVGLPESRGYLFEASVEGKTADEWSVAVEQHIEEYVPLPPADVVYAIQPLGTEGDKTHVVGIGYARRVVDEMIALFDEVGITIETLGSEIFALPRAVLPYGDPNTVLIIDIGRSSTKLLVVSHGLPRLSTTLEIGGHSLTLAVQKYFGVTEEEAKRVKAEKGLVPGPGSEEYLAAMLSTVSAIRDEVLRRFDYWESRKTSVAMHESISRAILVGGNATIRGLPEYLETALKVPVELGNVFTNFAPAEHWLPSLPYWESLGYGTAVGLTLTEHVA